MNKEKLYNSVLRKAKVDEKYKVILKYCSKRNVLDVGCIGQDIDPENPLWLHNKIKTVSKNVDGVDIEVEKIQQLKGKGFSILTPHKLEISGRKYDLIVMADVIEHVNDPINFLKTYSNFLTKTGMILITTPNALGISKFTSILLGNFYSVNTEHTMWFCPKTILEIINRAGLKFQDFFWLKRYYRFKDTQGFIGKLLYILDSIFVIIRRQFQSNFLIIITNPDKKD